MLLLLATLLAAAPDRLEQAQKIVEKSQELVKQVQKLVEQAKDEKDILKHNCAREKLAQVAGLLKVAETAEADLKSAQERREEDASERAFARVTIAGRKVAQLRQDAQQCIGQLAYYNDEKTRVDVDTPKDLPADPTALPIPPPIVFRPPPASRI